MRKTVYLDTETTGLDPRLHQIVELAWSVDDEADVHVVVPPHDLTHAEPKALEVNGYFERGLHLRTAGPILWARSRAVLCTDLAGAQIVAANPAFDAAMLLKLIGYAPWHYRLRDVEERAAAVFGWQDSPSLTTIAAELVERGHSIPANDHTAGGDVIALRACWRALDVERDRLSISAAA